MELQLEAQKTIVPDAELGISVHDVGVLTAIDGTPEKDSKFVREALKVLYKNEHEKLCERSVKNFAYKNRNMARSGNPKQEVSPVKMNKLRQWFDVRIKRHGINVEERMKQKYLNRLVGNALGNINRQQNKDNYS